jgi:hypothetical protein
MESCCNKRRTRKNERPRIMDDKPKIVFEKMPLYAIIGALIDLYDSGADFVDILQTGNPDSNIGLAVRPNYLNPDVSEETFSENIEGIKDNPSNMLHRKFMEIEHEDEEEDDDIYKDVSTKKSENTEITDLNDIIDGSI